MAFRYMKQNHGNETPSNLAFVHVQTERRADPQSPNGSRDVWGLGTVSAVRLEGRTITRKDFRQFMEPSEMWRFLQGREHKGLPLWIFAYDLASTLGTSFWFDLLEAGEYRVSVDGRVSEKTGLPLKPWKGCLVLEDSPAFCKVWGRFGKVNIVDVKNYFPMPLAKITGRECPTVPEIYGQPTKEAIAMMRSYGHCAGIEMAMVSLLTQWREGDCGVFQMTAGSLAMTNWRHTVVGIKNGRTSVQMACHDDQRANDWEREGFYPARVEPFYYGRVWPREPDAVDAVKALAGQPDTRPRGPVYEMDLCSFYPAVMASNVYPWKRLKSGYSCTWKDLEEMVKVDGVMAWVDLKTDKDTYPVRREGRNYHQCGEFTTLLCGNELVRAVERRHVRRVGSWRTYAMDDLFSGWVNRWFGERRRAKESGDDSRDLFCSMLLRSLFGKWGQKGKRWVDAPEEICEERWGRWHRRDDETGRLVPCRAIGTAVQRYVEGDDPSHSFPALAAFITSNARQWIDDLLRRMPAKSVYYVNTDCLYCNQAGRDFLVAEGLVDSFGLGKFRTKGVYEWAEINGVNDLILPGRVVKSGVPLDRVQTTANGWEAEIRESFPAMLARVPDGTIGFRKVAFKESITVWKNRKTLDGWSEPISDHGPPCPF